MPRPFRRAAIRQIARDRGCSLAVAATIYNLKSIREKQRLAERERRRAEIKKKGTTK